jgi:hypothetical protein
MVKISSQNSKATNEISVLLSKNNNKILFKIIIITTTIRGDWPSHLGHRGWLDRPILDKSGLKATSNGQPGVARPSHDS